MAACSKCSKCPFPHDAGGNSEAGARAHGSAKTAAATVGAAAMDHKTGTQQSGTKAPALGTAPSLLPATVPATARLSTYPVVKPAEGMKESDDASNTTGVCVRGLASTFREDDLHQLFTASGKIQRITIPRDTHGRPLGFALLEFETHEQAVAAVLLNNTLLNGNRLHVSFKALAAGLPRPRAIASDTAISDPTPAKAREQTHGGPLDVGARVSVDICAQLSALLSDHAGVIDGANLKAFWQQKYGSPFPGANQKLKNNDLLKMAEKAKVCTVRMYPHPKHPGPPHLVIQSVGTLDLLPTETANSAKVAPAKVAPTKLPAIAPVDTLAKACTKETENAARCDAAVDEGCAHEHRLGANVGNPVYKSHTAFCDICKKVRRALRALYSYMTLHLEKHAWLACSCVRPPSPLYA